MAGGSAGAGSVFLISSPVAAPFNHAANGSGRLVSGPVLSAQLLSAPAHEEWRGSGPHTGKNWATMVDFGPAAGFLLFSFSYFVFFLF